ncbi:MAG: glycosyl hydrolase family 43 [Chitinophagaceae bacterium]|nr:MAG: glycosyl hydrolase family 43 [Chitinophagaceae bacterium]
MRNGSDPWVIGKDGYYYYSQTMGNRIVLWKTEKMSSLGTASQVTVYTPPAGASNSANVWAPELHYLDGKWYIYYTAGSGPDGTQRTWVLENASADPTTGTWTDKGRIFLADSDFWAIDGTVMEYNGQRYFIWSGRPDLSQQKQNLYIAKMGDPWTLTGTTTMISEPVISWEVNGGPVNEGPEYLTHNGKNFLVYSASGCWTDDYSLGLLTLKEAGNPLLATDWTKSTQPVFTKNTTGKAYAPGHNAFFKSKDGSEDWILYHANSNSGDGCGEKRTVRMQEFTWNADGSPAFGTPVATLQSKPVPSGE